VASPRSEEFDEDSLSSGFGIPIVWGKLERRGESKKNEKKLHDDQWSISK
jgi:hypothetical protein